MNFIDEFQISIYKMARFAERTGVYRFMTVADVSLDVLPFHGPIPDFPMVKAMSHPALQEEGIHKAVMASAHTVIRT